MNKIKKYRYSEIFRSIQGEGHYSGIPNIWYRAWGCNFECRGFSQDDPTDPSSWDLPFENVDISGIKKMEDLPVFEKGCDSSYSWSKKFRHLAHQDTAEDIIKKFRELLPNGKFSGGSSGQPYHLAFTGGEPMMSQAAIVDIVRNLKFNGDPANFITIETNGTQMPRKDFLEVFDNRGVFHGELFWSCSPKLRASGEPWEKAIKPEVLAKYYRISKKGQLKYVVDGTDECWDEVKRATDLYREVGVYFPVWIMPVGARIEEQMEIQKNICEQSLDRGYNFAPRIHCAIYGNAIGT